MRIIAGIYKGRTLLAGNSKNTRPTADRVKESIFNILQPYIADSVVLDLFSGTGNLGLEALSRGSIKAIFVEKDHRALSNIKRNCEYLGCEGQVKIINKDVFIALEELAAKNEIFDIIFIDPPYEQRFEIPVIESIYEKNILKKDGVIILEHLAKDPQPNHIKEFIKIDERKYGNTSISFYRRGCF